MQEKWSSWGIFQKNDNGYMDQASGLKFWYEG